MTVIDWLLDADPSIRRGHRGSDGRWPLENVHEGEAHFQMDDGEGKPSRWNTLRALRVLDWFASGE